MSQCKALTKKRERCSFTAYYGGLCTIHCKQKYGSIEKYLELLAKSRSKKSNDRVEREVRKRERSQMILSSQRAIQEEVMQSVLLTLENLLYDTSVPKASEIPEKPKKYIILKGLKDEECSEPNMSCVICCENKKWITGNCGHVCVCVGCAKKIGKTGKKCPICRADWDTVHPVYI